MPRPPSPEAIAFRTIEAAGLSINEKFAAQMLVAVRDLARTLSADEKPIAEWSDAEIITYAKRAAGRG